ncbi:MAG: ABC transporter ATP-binding protein [Anaerolineales bacterium]|nr:ABC transporter ATP-binding protein [Anaerolineales bacterium]
MGYFEAKEKLLEIKNLRVSFPLTEGTVKAVNGVNLEIYKGEVMGIVGESGCGKSITAQAIMRIIDEPGQIDSGEILLHRADGEVVDTVKLHKNSRGIRQIRGGEVSMIFQEPMSSFSPVYTIGKQLTEAIIIHQKADKPTARAIAVDLLERVGIPGAENRIDEYPFEFSGGMRQRAMIAMALSCNPSLLVADEPTTALDVTIQAQILKLMKDIQVETNTAIMFITHNLGVIAQIADRIAIMYMGKVVEKGTVTEIFDHPLHPYTVNLLHAVPKISEKVQDLVSIRGSVPGPFEILHGCPFHERCDEMIPGVCDVKVPPFKQFSETHTVSCFLYE